MGNLQLQIKPWFSSLLHSMCMFPPALNSSFLGPDISPKLLARLLLSQVPECNSLMLDAIHSELSPRERRFLYGFFSTLWQGEHDVLEIGPFLGSSTRAICTGMQVNPRRQPGTKLYTYDIFKNYYTSEQDISMLKTCLPSEHIEHINRTKSFKKAFDYLHSNQGYSHLYHAAVGVLPDRASDISTIEEIFRLEPGHQFSAVFIDGCKSWYGTKYFFKEIAPHVPEGSFIIFQDFGHYTCFWIPAFVGLLKEHFQLVAYVDYTYTFELAAALEPAKIDSMFPDEPAMLSKKNFESLFAHLMDEATKRNDSYAMLSLSLQLAASLAYIGELDEARRIIMRLMAQPYFYCYRPLIRQALQCPTYSPDGPVKLSD